MPTDHTRCPIGGCSNRKEAHHVMCARDWNRVPAQIQGEVWFRYRSSRGSPEHLAIIAEAIRRVEAERGPRQMLLLDP